MKDVTLGLFGLLAVVSGSAAFPASDGEVCAIEQGALEPADLTALDRLGTAVAIDGDTAVVGAFLGDGVSPNSGVAYVFTRVGTQWQEQAKLVASDGKLSDRFGFDVDIDGDTVVVGAYFHGAPGVAEGAAYVFERQGTTWTETQKLTPPPPTSPLAWFGYSVRIDGDLMVVGAPRRESTGTVFVYQHVGSTWKRQAALRVDPTVGLDFGREVDLSGDRIAASAFRWFDNALIHIYQRTPTGWEVESVLDHPIPDADDTYGFSLALDGETLMVGAAGVNPPFPGSVFVYTFSGSSTKWLLSGELFAAGSVNGDQFGWSVALDRNMAIVGANGTDDEVGTAYVFARTAPFEWQEVGRVFSPLPGQAADFAGTVAISGGTAVIGADRANGVGTFSGAAWAFVFNPLPFDYCTAKPNTLGCLPTMAFTGTPSVSASAGFEITAVDVRNDKPGLLFYSLDGPAAIPFQGGTLCVATPPNRAIPVNSGGNPPPFNDCSGVLRLDWNAFAAGLLGGNPRPELRISGTRVNAQWWGRDNGGSFNSMLSDAIEFAMCQ